MDMGKMQLLSPSMQELINAPAIRSGADAFAPPMLTVIADVRAMLLLIKPQVILTGWLFLNGAAGPVVSAALLLMILSMRI